MRTHTTDQPQLFNFDISLSYDVSSFHDTFRQKPTVSSRMPSQIRNEISAKENTQQQREFTLNQKQSTDTEYDPKEHLKSKVSSQPLQESQFWTLGNNMQSTSIKIQDTWENSGVGMENGMSSYHSKENDNKLKGWESNKRKFKLKENLHKGDENSLYCNKIELFKEKASTLQPKSSNNYKRTKKAMVEFSFEF